MISMAKWQRCHSVMGVGKQSKTDCKTVTKRQTRKGASVRVTILNYPRGEQRIKGEQKDKMNDFQC